MEKERRELTPEEAREIEEHVAAYYGTTPRETTPEDVERLNAMLTLWRAQQQKEKTDRYPLCFRDWKIFGKRYLDELTPDELAKWNELHRGELGVPTNSEE